MEQYLFGDGEVVWLEDVWVGRGPCSNFIDPQALDDLNLGQEMRDSSEYVHGIPKLLGAYVWTHFHSLKDGSQEGASTYGYIAVTLIPPKCH
jgi:hypothetical protein